MIFKTIFTRSAALALGLGLALLLGSEARARGETVYFTPRQVLGEFFPHADAVRFERFAPSAPQRERLSRRLGYALGRDSYVFYVASTRGHVDGYALIDEELGQHEPITFAVQLSPDGAVERTEILVYRETRGEEVHCRRFLAQMRGKTVAQPVQAGVDIDTVSGATISSRSLAIGVRRALVLFDELVAHGPLTARMTARAGR